MKGQDNLIPITSETAKELGAKGGKAKAGSLHISTHIKNMLNDPNFELKLKNGEVIKGAPMEAIIKTAIAKAVSGDIKAFDILAKRGYGDKVDITSGGEPLAPPSVAEAQRSARRWIKREKRLDAARKQSEVKSDS